MTDTDKNPRFFDLVGNVRSMRRLKPDPVPFELIEKVLTAGVQAPSGQNLQPWAFVVIGDPERKQWFAERYAAAMESRFGLMTDAARRQPAERQLRAIYYQMDHMHEAPYLILVCGKRDWPFKVPQAERVGLAPPNFGAVYPCVQNMLLGLPRPRARRGPHHHAPGLRGRTARLLRDPAGVRRGGRHARRLAHGKLRPRQPPAGTGVHLLRSVGGSMDNPRFAG